MAEAAEHRDAPLEGCHELCVRLFPERTLHLTVTHADTMQQVSQQVRDAGAMPSEQHMRFICAGQELFPEDSVAKVLGCVVHCIASSAPARRHPATKTSAASKPHQPSAAASADVLDPGTVLLWIFGSILALLWLLLACFAHMFDKTSVVMLVMMTLAFLVPCLLSYAPAAVRVLDRFGSSSTTTTSSTQQSQRSPHAPWQQYNSGSSAMDSSWGSGIPPRPHAPRARLPPTTTSR